MSRLYGPVHRSLQDRFDTRRLAAAKDRIRARGHKLSHYLHREIMVMAMELLMAEPERFIAAAREAIVPELLRKAQGRSGRILSQSVTSPGPAGPENVGNDPAPETERNATRAPPQQRVQGPRTSNRN